jgi:pimeloyl-ACP methyl ester carboxylesterase
MAPLGALDAWARSGETMKTGSWAPVSLIPAPTHRSLPLHSPSTDPGPPPQDKATYRAIMKDNFGPAMNWYRAAIWGINLDDEKAALAAGEVDGKLHMPVFMLEASRDPLASVTKAAANMSKVADDLKVASLPTGHWVQLEEPGMLNGMLEEFVMDVEGRRGEGKL